MYNKIDFEGNKKKGEKTKQSKTTGKNEILKHR